MSHSFSHITSSRENWTFLKSHFQKEVTVSESSGGPGKTRSKFSHLLFFIFDVVSALSELVINVTQSCYLFVFFLLYIYFRNTILLFDQMLLS